MTKGTVLVASPSAIGRQPEASGSSVPAWPARLHRNSRLMAPTAWVEVMPTGLSRITQPWTSFLTRRNCCFFSCCVGGLSIPSPACGGGLGRGPATDAPPPDVLRTSTSPASGGGEERVRCVGSEVILFLVRLFRDPAAPPACAAASRSVPLRRNARRRGSAGRARTSG